MKKKFLIKSYKQMFMVIGIFTLILLVGGTTYAFFNYTRTGGVNTLKVGRISFTHTQEGRINLTNIFPLSTNDIINDTNPNNNVTINITGDTTYDEGIEYLVSAEDINITINDKKIPLSLYVSSTTDLGDNDPDYFTNRGGTTSIHKVLSGGVVIPGQYLVVGYIAPGETKVDGSLNIKAYIDKDKIKITDTYDGTESDNMGTTNEWVGDKTVFTTEEWNSIQSTGHELSFKIRVEANLGTWVDEATTPNLMNTISYNLTNNVTEVRFIQASPLNIQKRYDAAETKADLTYQETGKVLAWTEEKEVTPTGTSNSLNDIKPSFLVNENNDNNLKQIDNEKEYILYIASSGTTKLNTGRSLFSGMSKVKKIIFENIDTSAVTNMSSMFAGCSSLTSIDLKGFDTSNVTDMSSMFVGCSNLVSINLSNLGSEKLTSISGIFYNCSKLQEINMSNFNFGNTNVLYSGALGSGLSALKKINLSGANASKNTAGLGEMFKGCLSLEEVDMSGFIFGTSTNNMFGDNTSITTINLENADTSNVIDMRSMFNGCSSLTIINLNGINTSKVTDMQTMFAGCTSLTNIDLSDFDTSNVTYMTQMFSGCSNLVSINLSNLGSPKLTNIYRIFDNCIKLKEINMKNFNFGNITSFATSNNNAQLGNGLSSLKKINLSGANASKTTSMTQIFYGYSSLEEVDMSRFIFGTSISLLFAGNSSIISINLKDADTSNVTNMSSVFSGCSSLISIDLKGFDTSNVTDMRNMFYGCSSLTNIDISNFGSSKLEYISYIFDGCTNLEVINMSNFNFGNIQSLDSYSNVFNNLGSLKIINLSGANASNVSSVRSCFKNCNNLSMINLNNINLLTVYCMFDGSTATNLRVSGKINGLTSMAYMFQNCPNLINLDLKELNTVGITNMAYMFQKSNKLSTVDISNFDTSSVTDMQYMFEYTAVRKIDLSNLNLKNVQSFRGMFQNCKNLIDVNLKSLSGSNATNMSDMFSSCSELLNINISGLGSNNLTNISSIFSGCSKVEKLSMSNFSFGSSLNNPSSLFSSLTNVESIDMSNSNLGQATSLYYLFNGNANLKTVDLSNVNANNITNMSGMFGYCKKLEMVNFNNFHATGVTNMEGIFKNSPMIKTIDLSGFDTSKVTTMYGAFKYCSSLTTIYVSNLWSIANVTYGTEMFNEDANIKGGNGTVYDSSKIDKTMAVIDTPSTPGYLTLKQA